MCLARSDGQLCSAARACLASSHWIASTLSGCPCLVGNTGSVAELARSRIQARNTVTVWLVNGVARSFRPLPWHLTCGPMSRCRSAAVSEVSSLTRRPVWTATTSSAWSRRPIQVERSGLASSASTSSLVRKETSARSKRFWGMDRTRSIDPACSGCLSAAKRNREWIAARRALRVRTLLRRSPSRCSKKAAIVEASRSAKSSLDGVIEVRR